MKENIRETIIIKRGGNGLFKFIAFIFFPIWFILYYTFVGVYHLIKHSLILSYKIHKFMFIAAVKLTKKIGGLCYEGFTFLQQKYKSERKG